MKILFSAGNMPTAVNYENALLKSGAEAVSASSLPDSLDSFSGLLLCGGGDIDPIRYGKQNISSHGINTERDELELKLLDSFVQKEKPVFGICRGHQLINVFFGGTLTQNLTAAYLHTSRSGDLIHRVVSKPGSILSHLYGREFLVNSSHHQGIECLGKGLQATAYWQESVIEACEHSSLPVFSVQWHPERLTGIMKTRNTKDGAMLFKYFIKLCSRIDT